MSVFAVIYLLLLAQWFFFLLGFSLSGSFLCEVHCGMSVCVCVCAYLFDWDGKYVNFVHLNILWYLITLEILYWKFFTALALHFWYKFLVFTY